ncbi:MAG: thioredoxin family protein [Bacilli bacterium]
MEKNSEEFTNILVKFKRCLYIIMVLIIINIFVVIIVNGDNEPKKANEVAKQVPTAEEEQATYDVTAFKTIDVNGLEEAFNSENIQVIYFGRSTCGYCVKYLPILKQAQSEFDYQTLYVDVTTVDEEQTKTIKELDDFLKENYGTTPLVILVKDGKLIKGNVGYLEYEQYAKFLTDNGLEKKA